MAISLFDLFKVGVGPSSSHTVGPMLAAYQFAKKLEALKKLSLTDRIKIELYGSLGATGKGHGTGNAVLMGLEGELPDLINPDIVVPRVAQIEQTKSLNILKAKRVPFNHQQDLIYHRVKRLDFHANGMTFYAYDQAGELIEEATYYSVGGGLYC